MKNPNLIHFDVKFENDVTPIGLHIRATDKLVRNPGLNEMNVDILNKCIQHTIKILPNNIPVFVCSDDKKYKSLFNSVNVITQHGSNNDYNDFFALTKCSKIYMCSLFSSYAITASMVGGIPLVSYFPCEKSSLGRYNAIVEYELM